MGLELNQEQSRTKLVWALWAFFLSQIVPEKSLEAKIALLHLGDEHKLGKYGVFFCSAEEWKHMLSRVGHPQVSKGRL